MKGLGILLVIIGAICGFSAMTMDISHNGYNNLGLMNDRSNLTVGAGFAFIAGIILIGFSSNSSFQTSKFGNKKCPYCAEVIIKRSENLQIL